MAHLYSSTISRISHTQFCRSTSPLLLLLTLASLPVIVKADDKPPDRFAFSAGPYYVGNSSTTVAYSPEGVPARIGVNFNRDLGLQESAGSFRIDGAYHYKKRHSINMAWYRVERTGSAILNQDISWDGQEYLTGWEIGSTATTETIKINYLYSFYKSPQTELGIGAGLHNTRISTGLKVTSFGNISPPDGGSYGQQHALEATTPLPVLSFELGYNIASRWKAKWNIDTLYLSYEGIHGNFNDSNIAIEYRAFQGLGVGLGFNKVLFNLEGESNGSHYTANISYDATRIYLRGYF